MLLIRRPTTDDSLPYLPYLPYLRPVMWARATGHAVGAMAIVLLGSSVPGEWAVVRTKEDAPVCRSGLEVATGTASRA